MEDEVEDAMIDCGQETFRYLTAELCSLQDASTKASSNAATLACLIFLQHGS